MYNTIDIQVALVGMEVWSDGDKIKVEPNIGNTYKNFLKWYRSNLGKKKTHDHAQLLRWACAGQSRYRLVEWIVAPGVLCRDF